MVNDMTHASKSTLCQDRHGRKKIISLFKNSLDTNPDTFITYTVPTASLIQRHICEGSNSRENAHRRAATKASEMKYFTLSPGFLHRLNFLPLYLLLKGSALQHVLPRESVHTCKCTHAHAYTRRSLDKTKRGEETRFGMSLSVFYSCIILFCISPPWQGTGRLEQQSECDVTLC